MCEDFDFSTLKYPKCRSRIDDIKRSIPYANSMANSVANPTPLFIKSAKPIWGYTRKI
jgi:hypothetical protein